MAKVLAVCTSDRKGIQKQEVPEIVVKAEWGIEGDAHAGQWHRQVSLLDVQKIEDFRAKGAQVEYGAFGENIVAEGIDFSSLPVGSRFRIGDVLLELTQIGKECHSHCAIFHAVGDCIMPREGVFSRVLEGGVIRPGEEITVIPPAANRPFTAGVITLSDKGSQGLREDKSGPLICEMLREKGYAVETALILPDEKGKIERQLKMLADQRQLDLILTTGGTGFSQRDVTPEATLAVCDRLAPGIAEAIRAYSLTITPRAMLSRAASGIRKKTLIVNLPGSPKAVRESLEYILPSLDHGLGILRGTDGECGNQA